MANKLFIGNLDWGVTDSDLNELFSPFGGIEETVVVTDRFSGKSKGFGFVTFENDEDAGKAMAELDGSDFKGRPLAVKEARPPKERSDSY